MANARAVIICMVYNKRELSVNGRDRVYFAHMERHREERIDSSLRKLNQHVGRVQDRQGSEGCYMELLRFARSAAELIRRHSYMFERPEREIDGIRKSLWRLPQNQSWKVVQRRTERIEGHIRHTRQHEE